MLLDPGLIANSISSGLLLGCLYAIAAMGLAVSFGMLDIANIAQPALMILCAFVIAVICTATGFDPLLMAVLLSPVFAVLGALLYRGYYLAFERKGDQAIRGLAFFFGLMFIVEVGLLMIWGADQRWVNVGYSGGTLDLGPIGLPYRMLWPALLSLTVIGLLLVWMRRTFTGRAMAAVAQDPGALRFLGIDPIRIKTVAFAISVGLAAIAGGCLIVIQPVEPQSGHVFIGRVFAIVIMAGMGSLPGTLLAALVFGVIENLTATIYGPSWSPAVAFGLLLLFLAVRPQGLFGRAH